MRMAIPDEVKKMTDAIIPFLQIDQEGKAHLKEGAPPEIVELKKKRDQWFSENKQNKR